VAQITEGGGSDAGGCWARSTVKRQRYGAVRCDPVYFARGGRVVNPSEGRRNELSGSGPHSVSYNHGDSQENLWAPTERSQEPPWLLAILGGYLLTRLGWTGQSSADDSDYHRCFFGFGLICEICGSSRMIGSLGKPAEWGTAFFRSRAIESSIRFPKCLVTLPRGAHRLKGARSPYRWPL